MAGPACKPTALATGSQAQIIALCVATTPIWHARCMRQNGGSSRDQRGTASYALRSASPLGSACSSSAAHASRRRVAATWAAGSDSARPGTPRQSQSGGRTEPADEVIGASPNPSRISGSSRTSSCDHMRSPAATDDGRHEGSSRIEGRPVQRDGGGPGLLRGAERGPGERLEILIDLTDGNLAE